jgi:hypothetical protein
MCLLVQTAGILRDRLDINNQGLVGTQEVSVLLAHDINLKAEVTVTALKL